MLERNFPEKSTAFCLFDSNFNTKKKKKHKEKNFYLIQEQRVPLRRAAAYTSTKK